VVPEAVVQVVQVVQLDLPRQVKGEAQVEDIK
jgi:hypothetical protein